MRRLVMLCALAACGSSSSNPIDAAHGGDGPKTDAPSGTDVGNYDFQCGTGAACSLDKVCCTMPGAQTTFGCVAPGSCPMADKISCDGPQDCTGGQICCGSYVPDGTGNPPQCGITSIGASCASAASCPTNLVTNSCNETTTVTLCQHKADCTDATNNRCCTFASGAASLTFCIDQTTANLGGATCHN